jgi:hypothetical protein
MDIKKGPYIPNRLGLRYTIRNSPPPCANEYIIKVLCFNQFFFASVVFICGIGEGKYECVKPNPTNVNCVHI